MTRVLLFRHSGAHRYPRWGLMVLWSTHDFWVGVRHNFAADTWDISIIPTLIMRVWWKR